MENGKLLLFFSYHHQLQTALQTLSACFCVLCYFIHRTVYKSSGRRARDPALFSANCRLLCNSCGLNRSPTMKWGHCLPSSGKGIPSVLGPRLPVK